MKKLIGALGLIALGTCGSVWAEEVNFRAVNPAYQSIVDAVTTGDDIIDFAYPRFDEGFSSIKEEKLKYDLQGVAKNTPWLEGGRAEAVGTSSYWADHTPGKSGIHVTMSAIIRTDVMALIRYSAYISLKKYRDDVPFQFKDRYEAHLKRLAVASTLAQVHELLVSGQRLAKDLAIFEVERQRDRLRCLENGTCLPAGMDHQKEVDRQKSLIKDWEDSLPGYDQVQMTAKTEKDVITQLTLSHVNLDSVIPTYYKRDNECSATIPANPPGEAPVIKCTTRVLIPADAQITLTAEAAVGSSQAFYQMPEDKLNELKASLQGNILGVQEGVFSAKEKAQKKFRSALIKFKSTIRGED